MKISEIQAKAPKILLYGDLGVGKTALALTLGERAQVIDMDDGLLTAVTLADKFKADRLKVEVSRFIEDSPHKKAMAFSAAKNCIFGISNDCSAGKYKYDALIIDSFSALAEAAVMQVIYNSGQLGKPIEIQHWGLAFQEIKNLIAVLRGLPIVVVMIAHEQLKSIGKGVNKEDKLEIALPGKNLASQIARYFDEIWYMRSRPIGGGKSEYIIQTFNSGSIPCRSRANIPDMTNTNIGMWELVKLCGYTPPEKKNG